MPEFESFSNTEISLVDNVSPGEVNGVVTQSCVCCNVGTFFKGFCVSGMFINSFFKHLPIYTI